MELNVKFKISNEYEVKQFLYYQSKIILPNLSIQNGFNLYLKLKVQFLRLIIN